MDLAALQNLSSQDLAAFNRCQLAHKVYFLSDIMDGGGHSLWDSIKSPPATPPRVPGFGHGQRPYEWIGLFGNACYLKLLLSRCWERGYSPPNYKLSSHLIQSPIQHLLNGQVLSGKRSAPSIHTQHRGYRPYSPPKLPLSCQSIIQ